MAAERQRGAALHASSAAKSGSECLASSAHPLNGCSVDTKAIAGDSKKRKLPLSFAQQEKRPAPATTAALDYKVDFSYHLDKADQATPVVWSCSQHVPGRRNNYQKLDLPLFSNMAIQLSMSADRVPPSMHTQPWRLTITAHSF